MPGINLQDPRDISNSTLRDLLKTTLENHPWDGKFEVLQKYHTYPVCNQWFQRDKVVEDGGVSIIRNVQLDENGSAKFTRPYESAAPVVTDVQARLRAQWVQATADYSISRQEMLRNRSTAKLIDLVDTRRIAAMADLANLLEDYAWKVPTSSSDDLHPTGIPYWIVPATIAQQTAATYGHQGTFNASFSDCAGIDASTEANSRWRNYNDTWLDATGDIGEAEVQKITRMLRRLRFESPQMVSQANEGAYANTRLYACEVIIESLEDRARLNNDALGADVGRYAGATVIKNLPVQWVEQLDATATQLDTCLGTNPFVAINHAYFFPFVMEGDYFRETGPMNDRDQHDVFTTFIDIQFNYICTNRQKGGGVISRKSAA